LEMGANWAFQLYGDKQAFVRARDAILERLRRHSTKSGSSVLPAQRRERRARAAQAK